MNKFLSFPVSEFNIDLQAMGLPLNHIPATIKVRPEHIIAYSTQTGDDHEDNIERVNIFLSSGESFTVEMTMSEFESTYKLDQF